MLGSFTTKIGIAHRALPFAFVISAGTAVLWLANRSNSAVGNAAAAPGVPDPSSVLNDRSPGDRDSGALFQTKPLINFGEAADRPTGPQAYFAAPSSVPPIDEVPRAFAAIVPPDDVPYGGPTSVPIGAVGSGTPGNGISPFLPVLVPPFGVPVAFAPPAGTAPPGTDMPGGGAAPVPEPRTWLTIMIGFLMVGVPLRRGRTALRLRGR